LAALYGSLATSGVTRGQGGAQFPGRRINMGRQKVPTMSQVLSSVPLLRKDLRFEYGGAKHAS